MEIFVFHQIKISSFTLLPRKMDEKCSERKKRRVFKLKSLWSLLTLFRKKGFLFLGVTSIPIVTRIRKGEKVTHSISRKKRRRKWRIKTLTHEPGGVDIVGAVLKIQKQRFLTHFLFLKKIFRLRSFCISKENQTLNDLNMFLWEIALTWSVSGLR